MVRRLITLCAILGYLAGQMAALPHAHADEKTPGHSSVPHVHLSWLTGKPHAHDRGHHHHGHRHESAHKVMPPTAAISCSHDHDADAVYFVAGSTGMAARDGSEVPWLKAHPAHQFLMYAGGAPIDGTGRGFSAPPHPPDGGHLGCALYLKLRTLRI